MDDRDGGREREREREREGIPQFFVKTLLTHCTEKLHN